jgi:L-fuculose-phosphate aldolase
VKNEELDEFIKICHYLGIRGWFPGSSGNASILDVENALVYIKESGKPMTFVTKSDLIVIDMNGNVVEGNGRPSKEFRFHLGIYKKRKDIRAVIHAHPPYATAFAIANKEIPLKTAPGIAVLKKVPMIDYCPPGSEDLAAKVIACFGNSKIQVALLKGHGIVAVGKNILDACKITEWTEDAAKEAFLSSLIEDKL